MCGTNDKLLPPPLGVYFVVLPTTFRYCSLSNPILLIFRIAFKSSEVNVLPTVSTRPSNRLFKDKRASDKSPKFLSLLSPSLLYILRAMIDFFYYLVYDK